MTVSEATLVKMEKYGGSFVRNLAVLYRVADWQNKKKIEKVFKEYFDRYEKFNERVILKG